MLNQFSDREVCAQAHTDTFIQKGTSDASPQSLPKSLRLFGSCIYKKKENPFSSSEEAAANTLLLPSIWSQRGRRNKSSSASKSADKSRKKGKKKGNTKEKGNRFCLTLRKNFIFVVSGFSCRNRLLCINGWRTSDMFIRWTKSCKWI